MTHDEEQDIRDILAEYDGNTVLEMAQAAVAEVTWLKEQLDVSQSRTTALESEAKLLRILVRRCREVLETNDPYNARNIFGPQHEKKAQKDHGA